MVGPNQGIAGTWHPAGTLPAPETGQRSVEIFYTPHPDDETLSMAPLIARATAAGARVIIVGMTDGDTSGALGSVNARLGSQTPPLTPQAFGQARTRELFEAAAALGVPRQDVFLAHLDAVSSDCGTLISVGEATDVMTIFSKRFPGATHVTMSFVDDRNLDHLACGEGLKELVASGGIRRAEWTVSRLWWSLPGPPQTWVLPADRAQREAIAAAARAYSVWDPSHHSYAIGLASVRPQFQALELDPRARIHAAP